MTFTASPRLLSLFNLRRPEVIADPYAFYGLLHRNGPIHWDRYLSCWLVLGYPEVRELLHDPRLSAAMDHTGTLARYVPARLRPAFVELDRHVSFTDPPDHTRLRGALGQPLRRHRVDQLTEYIDEVVRGLFAGLAPRRRMDFVTDFGYRLPLLVIVRMLRLTGVSLERLREWSNAWGDIVGSFGHLPDHADRLAPIAEEFVAHLRDLVADHRAHPRPDVTSELLAAVDSGELTEDELVANLMFFVTGGHETTANLTSGAVLALLRRPDLARALRERPELVPAAVEELLRHESPTQYTGRVATEGLTVGGVDIQPGQSVVLMLAAANRDPGTFADPDEFDLYRQGPRHVAFGHGAHFCFGAPLARAEACAALRAFLAAVRGARLAGDPAWRLNGNLRGLASLPVEFDEIAIEKLGNQPCRPSTG